MPMPCVQDNNTGENKCINDKAVAEELVDYWQTELAETLQDAPQSQELLKVGFGPVAALIHKNIVQTIKGVKEQAAFSLYSGHDTTLTPLLGLFKSDDTRWPPYASNLLIELWTVPSHSKDKYVRILYNNKVLTTKSKWCDLSWCPVKTFLQYLDQFLPGEDYLQKCQEGPIM
ncbi:Lysophosphatidic acid phosphatase type 6 [Linnemannia zychae]|nr:Lysophosphatidic acid phosphatase type 6 [Linnemannia zychae]